MIRPNIRLASLDDLGAINAIYNHYVLASTCTYEYEPVSADDRRAWFEAHGPLHPVTVAEADGEVVGWGSISKFHPRIGYRHSVENSVYVRSDCQRRGIGRAILADLIDRARTLGHHTIIAGISAEQAASIRLHEALGFTQVAHLRQVGHKFDQWLDVVYWQLLL